MEEMEIGNKSIKEVEIEEGNIKYKCQIKIKKEFLFAFVFNDIIKYKGQIHISNILYKLGIYDYNINEIFDEIYILNNNKFNLIKDANKYILQIEFIILNKKRYINIDLYDNINNNHDDYIKLINELKEIINEKDKKIKALEEELSKYKEMKKDDLYNNFNIKDKKPKYILKYHTLYVCCSTVLKDGRFVTGSYDNSIIVYNNKTFKPDLIIKEHNGIINNVIQLSSGNLASCSQDNTIKIYDINENIYKVIQTLSYHKNQVTKIIELNNKQLVSCSWDKTIIFYNKDENNEYKKDFSISTNGSNGPVIQTKINEISYSESSNHAICFYDFIKKNNNKKINNINLPNYSLDSLLMISKDLLLITGENKILIVNVNTYDLIKTIKVYGSGWIYSTCMLNKDIILTADNNKRIIQWKIENDNLKLISKKENAHNESILTLSKLGNGLIVSGSKDGSVIIW